jgi:DUF4097 and DUF4098 domain-containing protein YvlB
VLLLTGPARTQSDDLREEFHQSYHLDPNGRFKLSNINGSVNISGWDNSEIRVDAVKHALDAEDVRQCRIVVDSHPDFISIETRYPDRNWWWWFGPHTNPATVDYTIRVPRKAAIGHINLVNGTLTISSVAGPVHGSTVNGSVRATDLSGPVDLSTVNSTVEVIATGVGNDLQLHSVNGRVVLTMPSDAQGRISASTVNGSIENDFGLTQNRNGFVGAHLDSQLGAGGARIHLSTVNGGIELRRANDGKSLSKPRPSDSSDEPI